MSSEYIRDYNLKTLSAERVLFLCLNSVLSVEIFEITAKRFL